jgi:hypothetical protein
MQSVPSIIRVIIFAGLMSPLSMQSSGLSSTAHASPQAVPPDTLVTLERTTCFGPCPEYKIAISAAGEVVFEGRRFVRQMGTAKSSISPEALRELLGRFENIDYFSLRDRYAGRGDGCKQRVTDLPTVITSIKTNGRSKSVRHYHGCWGVEALAELEKIERAIDDAVNSAQWIR